MPLSVVPACGFRPTPWESQRMINKLSRAAMLMTGLLAVSGCTFGQAKTTAPASRPPAADYQEPGPPPPASALRARCYSADEISMYRVRMVHQEFQVLALQ